MSDDELEIITLPGMELQIHRDLSCVVLVLGPWLKERIQQLTPEQDRIGWPITADQTSIVTNTNEAVQRSLKIMPKDTDGG